MTSIAIAEPIRPVDYYMAILRRRKWTILLVFTLVFAAAAAVAILWPPVFRSSAIILVEDPEIPDDLVKSTVTSFAGERLQVIQQRVMTTENLIGIIGKFNLYADDRRRKPISIVADRMRESISLDLVSADVTDPRSGRTTNATIAFTLSFDGDKPQTTQQVTSELVTLYLSENLRARQAQAAGTAGFLSAEAQRLAEQIQKLEAQLAEFKTKYAGSLPEQLAVNTQLLDRTESRLMQLMQEDQALHERQIYLEAQLAQLDPYISVGGSSQAADSAAQLQLLQGKYLELSAKFGSNHPDVIALRRQIQALGATGAGGRGFADLAAKLDSLEAELAQALQKFGEAHPDVNRLRREIDAARSALASAGVRPVASGGGEQASNPVYIQIQAQLNGIKADLDANKPEEQALKLKIKEIEARVFNTPEVERIYANVRRDYETSIAKYNEIKTKETAAQMAESLEAERKSERFSVIEPPNLPVEPIKPNRPGILLFGVVFAAGVGIGGSTALDILGGRIYGQRQLGSIVGDVLAVVPRIRTKRDRWKTRLWAGGFIAVVLAAISAVGAYLHWYVAPLDVLWVGVLNHFPLW